jgi:hypothetical protein
MLQREIAMAADRQRAYRLLDRLGPANSTPWFICSKR